MAAGKLDIYIEQGAEFRIKLTLKMGGIPVDLTGHVFAAQIRKTTGAQEVVAAMQFEAGNSAGGVAGVIPGPMTAQIPCSQSSPASRSKTTDDRPLAKFLWDCISKDPDGRVYRWLEGTASVSPSVTRVT